MVIPSSFDGTARSLLERNNRKMNAALELFDKKRRENKLDRSPGFLFGILALHKEKPIVTIGFSFDMGVRVGQMSLFFSVHFWVKPEQPCFWMRSHWSHRKPPSLLKMLAPEVMAKLFLVFYELLRLSPYLLCCEWQDGSPQFMLSVGDYR